MRITDRHVSTPRGPGDTHLEQPREQVADGTRLPLDVLITESHKGGEQSAPRSPPFLLTRPRYLPQTSQAPQSHPPNRLRQGTSR
jgi:hypothetical protein